MRDEDVPVVERLSSHTFLELDLRTVPRSWPEPTGRPPGRAEKWVERTRRQLVTDAGGCWVAELSSAGGVEIVGFATSETRELMWVLSSYGVRPGLQGRGIGRALLAELVARCQAAGARQMLAVIGDSANHGSIGVHRALGFERCGLLQAVGWKFGRWLDVVLLQRALGAGAHSAAQDNAA